MRKLYFALSSILLLNTTAYSQTFSSGNMVVVRVGDGQNTLSNTGNTVFLDEYNAAGILLQSLQLPDSGAQKLVLNGLNATEGLITRSPDGRFLALAGYAPDVFPYPASITFTQATQVPRCVAIIDGFGNMDLTTRLTDFATGGSPLSAVTSDGNNIWVSGTTNSVRYAMKGDSTSVALYNIGKMGQVNIADGQLYATTSSTILGNKAGLGTIGSGLPVTGFPLPYNSLTGLPPVNGTKRFGFFFADINPAVPGSDVLYIADEESAALSKFSLVSGNWSYNGSFGTDSDDYRSVTGKTDGDTVILFATRKGGSTSAGGGELVVLKDTSGHNGNFLPEETLLATAAPGTAFRGVALTPEMTPLSIRLTGFNAVQKGHKVLLTWKVEKNQNISGFELQKSADGKTFIRAGIVRPTWKNELSFSFSDENPFSGNNFYRLKMIENSGNLSYSSVYMVSFSSPLRLTISPNPAKNNLVLNLDRSFSGGTVSLIYSNGKPIFEMETDTQERVFSLDISKLAPGTYFLEFKQGAEKTVKAFIKMND